MIAIHTLWLAARAEGVGLGCVSILNPEQVQADLDIPSDWTFTGYLCLSYPEAEDTARRWSVKACSVDRHASVSASSCISRWHPADRVAEVLQRGVIGSGRGTRGSASRSRVMDPYIVVLAGFGVIVLLTAWLPMLLKELPLSLPIFCVGLGAAIFAIPDVPGVAPHPQEHLKLTERLTEFVVIVALMGAGLKLDRPLAWKSYLLTWRLLGIAMPLTIVALAALAHLLLGLGAASALLLAAALAPTDPVLASDVQVGPPGGGEEDEVRFALTSEAGLNDGLAFPFVNLAIALAMTAQTGETWFGHWLTVDVVWKLGAGVVVGWVLGRALGWLTFRLPNRAKLSRTGDGFVALGITAVAYGLTEMAQGYGFLAVFVAAVAFRSVEKNHDYHQTLHDFIEQLERLLMMILLVMFGGAISGGSLLQALSWPVVLFALLTLFLVRPLSGWVSLLGRPEPGGERAVISFFGIRGLGSAYYLAYALGHARFEAPDLL